MTNFNLYSDYTLDGKPSLGFEPNDKSWKYQASGRNPSLLTNIALGANSIYTQSSIDSMAYPQTNYVAAHIYSDQQGTLYFEVSADNVNWDIQASLSVTANIPVFLPYHSVKGRYYRFRYVNGGTAQTIFRLEQITANQLHSDTLNGNLKKLDSTTTALAANGNYSSASVFSLSNYDKIVGTVFSDQAGTLNIQQSWDGVNWDVQSTITVSASAGQGFNIDVVAPFGRLSYTNGSTVQTAFRLYAGGKVL